MLTVASADVRTLAPKQETRGYAKISGCMLLGRVYALESQWKLVYRRAEPRRSN